MSPIIKLSDNAANRIKEIMSDVESKSIGVRVAVKSGGCAGMSYVMEYAKEVNPRTTFLHDGRAKTILEAVLWHSGEANQSLAFLLDNYKDDLEKLEKFLKSL